jgi:adenosylhomocysteine nucleosidase
MTEPAKYVIVAALETEVAAFVRGWERFEIERLKCWRRGEFVTAVAGMGWDKAFRGTKVVIEALCPELVTSIGFAGSLSTNLKVGSIFVPAQVIGFKNGVAYQTGFGRGTLVSAAGVIGSKEKAETAARYSAVAVDMEAAAVAEACANGHVRFAALKSISDDVEDEMDFVGGFVTPDGFKTGAFLAHVALRPRLWKALAKLSRNTSRATEALTTALLEFTVCPEKFLAESTNLSSLEAAPSVGQSARK